MKHTLITLLAAIFITACSTTTPAPMTAALPSPTIALTQTPVSTLTLTPTTPAETTVTAGSEAALMGLPVGSERVGNNYIYHAKTGDVVVGKVDGGKIEAEEFLQYKIYATAEEALQHPWPIRLDENGKPVGPFMEGGAGDLCQLSAEPLPENVVTGKDVGFFALQNPGQPVQIESLRWGTKEAQDYYDQHPEDLPVTKCGVVAGISPLNEEQKDYIGVVWEWKNPDGSYVYITLLYNKALYIAENLGNRNIPWSARVPLDIELNPVVQSQAVIANIFRNQEIHNLVGRWEESNSVPSELQDHAIAGTIYDYKAKK